MGVWTLGVISGSVLLSADIDVTDPAVLHSKGAEIASWFYDNNMQQAPYVIIDDGYVTMESQLLHFVQTDSYDGLTETLATRAIRILSE